MSERTNNVLIDKFTHPDSLLSGTGFNAVLSINSFRQNLNNALKEGLNFDEAIKMPLEEIKGDVLGYKLEYILQEALLPNPIEFRYYQGKKRVFNKFSNTPISEGILKEERNGAVERSLCKAENFLLNSPEGSLGVMVSPAGKSGMKDKKGEEIVYPDTQIYMWRVGENNKLESFTLVLDDFTSKDCLEVLAYLGIKIDPEQLKKLSEYQLQSLVMDTPVFLTANETQKFSFEDVIKTAQFIKKSEVVRTTHGINKSTKTFNEVYKKLKQGEALLESDQVVDSLINNYLHNLRGSARFINNLEIFNKSVTELEVLIINMTQALSGEKIIKIPTHLTTLQLQTLYQPIIRRLEAIPGCAGGGVLADILSMGKADLGIGVTFAGTAYLYNGLSFRRVEIEDEIKCPHCDFVNKCKPGPNCRSCRKFMLTN